MRRSRSKVLLALAGAAALAGCAALKPQFYAPDIATMQPPAVSPAVVYPEVNEQTSLNRAVWLARAQQAQYAAVVQSLNDSSSGLSVATLIMAVGGAVTALTGGQAKELGILAALTTGLFVSGSSFVPKERASAFGAGITTLECAIGKAVALDDPQLQSQISTAHEEAMQLGLSIAQLKQWAQPVTRTAVKGGPAAGCGSTPFVCTAGDRCRALEAQYARACAPATRTQSTLPPDPAVTAQLTASVDLQKSLYDSISAANAYLGEADLAGVVLLARARAIGETVRIEADKTRPDVAMIKAAVNGTDLGVVFATAPKPAKTPEASPAAGQALSSNAERARSAAGEQAYNYLRGEDLAHLRDIQQQYAMAYGAWRVLQGTLDKMKEKRRQASGLDQCAAGTSRNITVVNVNSEPAPDSQVEISDALRLNLATFLGVDSKQANAGRLVDEALKECRDRGVLSAQPAANTLSGSALVKVMSGACRK